MKGLLSKNNTADEKMSERKKKLPNRHVFSDDELEIPVSLTFLVFV